MLHSGWGFGLAKVLSFNGYFLQVPLTACRRIANKHFLTACVFASLQELKSWCHKTHGGDTLETPSCRAELLGFSLRRNCMAMTWFWDQSPAQRMGWAHFAGCVRSRIRNHFWQLEGHFFLACFFWYESQIPGLGAANAGLAPSEGLCRDSQQATELK